MTVTRKENITKTATTGRQPVHCKSLIHFFLFLCVCVCVCVKISQLTVSPLLFEVKNDCIVYNLVLIPHLIAKRRNNLVTRAGFYATQSFSCCYITTLPLTFTVKNQATSC